MLESCKRPRNMLVPEARVTHRFNLLVGEQFRFHDASKAMSKLIELLLRDPFRKARRSMHGARCGGVELEKQIANLETRKIERKSERERERERRHTQT